MVLSVLLCKTTFFAIKQVTVSCTSIQDYIPVRLGLVEVFGRIFSLFVVLLALLGTVVATAGMWLSAALWVGL